MILTWYQSDTTHLDFFFLLLCSFGFYFSLFRFLSIFIFLRKFQQIYHHCFLLFISLFFDLFSPCSFSQENFCSVIPFFLELDLVKKFLPVLNFLKVFHGVHVECYGLGLGPWAQVEGESVVAARGEWEGELAAEPFGGKG